MRYAGCDIDAESAAVPRLAAFAGVWRLDRRIADARAGQDGQFVGQAHLAENGDHWLWTENGQLTMGDGAPMTATRRYRWTEPAPGQICVWFDDGRPFHDLAATARHDCAPDFYQVTYDFADWPVWRCRWKVTGPRKDYVMETTHRRS